MRAKVTDLDLETLNCTVTEHFRYSYYPALRRCVDAGLVNFSDNGRGFPVLTEAGRAALTEFRGRMGYEKAR